jgi:serine/threonine protein phosphatase PrpC
MPLQLRYVAHSEIGLIRKNNQDSGYASPHLLVVADGMGGAAAGDLASAVAIDSMRKIDGPSTGEHMLEVLAGAIQDANDKIAELVESDLSLDGMGTTVTSAMFDGVGLGLAHIGDSRAYLYRDGHLERLTHDHTWVQSLVDDGKISESEAAMHPHRSLLLKVLNGQPTNDPDLTIVPVKLGDRLMFCSDGVCGLIDDDMIMAGLQLSDINDALRRLVVESLNEGGIDNITVIVADVVESGGNDDLLVLGAASEQPIRAPGAPRRQLQEDDEAIEETLVTRLADFETTPDDEERYSPQAPHHGRIRRPVIGILVLVLVAVAGLGMAYAWTRTQYFVGADRNNVAIFQGLSESIPGLSLSRVYEVQQLTVGELPPFYQEQVRARIDVPSLDSARATVAELGEAAKRCTPRPTTSARPSASPGSKASPSPSQKSGGKPSPQPSAPATDQAEPNC